MMSKTDCLSILVSLEDRGINIDTQMKKLLVAKEPPLEVVRFIANHQGIEVANFYEMLRKRYNKKKSPLYKNILDLRADDTDELLVVLSCFLVQINLYAKKLSDKTTFLEEVRAEEITRVLNDFYKTGNTEGCVAVLRLLKSDLMVLEYIRGRRELQ